MNLHTLLAERQARGNPVRVGIIGCGKFASMYLAQLPRTPGVHVAAIADLDPGRARANLAAVGWPEERYAARGLDAARRDGTTWVTDDGAALFENTVVDLLVDATGDPAAGVVHALRACAHGKSIVMVNVEADALAGPLLARRAREAGVIYSLAYGDQPALICELVDWARTAGFDVAAAGRGHKWRPEFRGYTPDNVWDGYGLTPEQAKLGGLNPRMFTSFLDGTKPAIESTAVANATGLTPAPGGLAYPPCRYADLPNVMRPRAAGGQLDHRGQVEVISSLHPDGTPVGDDVRWGVWVVVEAGNDYVARCFGEYGLATDDSGRYAGLYKRWHLIGLELGVTVASVGCRREATGAATGWRADAVALAKRDLAAGETLDGEGGYTVSGQLMTAAESRAAGALPIGLANKVALRNPVPEGRVLTWADVAVDETAEAVGIRREMERRFAPDAAQAAE
jgi:predicted homoserine dehydrogenase-like protein